MRATIMFGQHVRRRRSRTSAGLHRGVAAGCPRRPDRTQTRLRPGTALEEVSSGYRAMNDREATKVLVEVSR